MFAIPQKCAGIDIHMHFLYNTGKEINDSAKGR